MDEQRMEGIGETGSVSVYINGEKEKDDSKGRTSSADFEEGRERSESKGKMTKKQQSKRLLFANETAVSKDDLQRLNLALKGVPIRAVDRALKKLQMISDCKMLCVHLLFLLLYSWIFIGTLQIGATYMQVSAIEDAILDEEFVNDGEGPYFKKNFYDIYSFDEYFQWVKGPLLNAIYNAEYYNGEPFEPSSSLVLPAGLSGNRVVGPIRFRTARVQPNYSRQCKEFDADVVPDYWLNNSITACFPAFRSNTQDSSPWRNFTFKRGMSKVRGIDGYGGDPQIGYGNDGYVFYLPTTKEVNGSVLPLTVQDANDLVERELIQNFWADKATRVLVVDFNLVSFNLGNAMTCRMVAEVMAGGGWFLYWRMYSIILNPLASSFDSIRLAGQIVLLIWSVINAVYQTHRLVQKKWALLHLFSSLWNFVGLANDYLSVAVVSMLIHAEYVKFGSEFTAELTGATPTDEPFMDVFEEARFMSYIGYLACINLAFACLKVFNYLRHVTRLTIMWEALAHAFPDILALVVAFIILNTAFVLIGHILFGFREQSFHSVLQSYSTLFRSIVGDFNYVRIWEADPNVAGFYYMLVLFFQFFTLLNMFIAVVTETYSATKSSMEEERNRRANDITRSWTESKKDSFLLWINSVYFASGSKDCFSCCSRSKGTQSRLAADSTVDLGGGSMVGLDSDSPRSQDPVDDVHADEGLSQDGQDSVKEEDLPRREHARSTSSHLVETTVRVMQQFASPSVLRLDSVSARFKTCPSNWIVDRWKPVVLLNERAKWINSINQRNKPSNQKSKTSPYRKMWWYACHKVCADIRDTRRREDGLTAEERAKRFRQEVQLTRIFLENRFGANETKFSRNWNNVLNASKYKRYINKLALRVQSNPIRMEITAILRRAVKRHRRAGSNLFSMFRSTWGHLSNEERDRDLNFEDVLKILGHSQGDKEAFADAKSFMHLCSALSLIQSQDKSRRMSDAGKHDSEGEGESDTRDIVMGGALRRLENQISNIAAGLSLVQKDITKVSDMTTNPMLPRQRGGSLQSMSFSKRSLASIDPEEQRIMRSHSQTAFVGVDDIFMVTFVDEPLGMEIGKIDSRFIVTGVTLNSQAESLGICVGDRLVAVELSLCSKDLSMAELTTMVSKVTERPLKMMFQRPLTLTRMISSSQDGMESDPGSVKTEKSVEGNIGGDESDDMTHTPTTPPTPLTPPTPPRPSSHSEPQ